MADVCLGRDGDGLIDLIPSGGPVGVCFVGLFSSPHGERAVNFNYEVLNIFSSRHIYLILSLSLLSLLLLLIAVLSHGVSLVRVRDRLGLKAC